MEELGNLAHGFGVALTLPNIGFMFVGIILGVLIGVLPGLGGANGVAILLPLTFTMAEVGDIAALQAFGINPVSSSPKAMARYRDLCVIALTVRVVAKARC